jgi:hypothetical protein
MNFENNEDFLKELEKDYPDTDWDNLPSEDSQPDVWHIDGMQWQRLHFYAQPARPSNNFRAREEGDNRNQVGIGFGEIDSEEKALKLLAETQDPNSKWGQERFDHHSTIPVDGVEVPWSDSYHGPVIPETMKIRKSKPWAYESLQLMALLRKECLENPDKQIFPMYLP